MPSTVESLQEDVRRLEHSLQKNLLESAIDFSAQFVNPNEALFDDDDFFVPLGAWEAVPWTIDNHKRGEVLPVYLTEQGLKLIRDVSRKQCSRNPYAINARRNRVSYIVGSGMVPRAQKAGDNCPDALVKAVQAVVDEFIQYGNWGMRQREIVDRCDRDGEALLWWFPQSDGSTACRFIEPEHCRAKGGSNSRVMSFGVETLEWDVEDVQAYWIVSNPDTATADLRVPASEIQHFRLNVDSTAKRGLPTFYPVRPNLDRAEKLLRNMSLMAQIQATFALIRKYKGYQPGAVQAASANDVDYSITGPTRVNNFRQYQPGTILDASDNVTYDFPAGNVNAAAFVEVLQAELRAIASMLVMPEFMLTSDASNANYSSTMISESPAVKNFEGLQYYFKKGFGEGVYTPKEAKNIPALWRVIRNAVRAGRLPRAALYLTKLQLEAPSLIVRDKLQEAQRKQILKMNRILSPQTWAMQEDLDYEQEQQNFEEADERTGGTPQQLPLPGQGDGSGGNNPGLKPPTQESLREGKDASGHEHAADGRFGSGGSSISSSHKEYAGPGRPDGKFGSGGGGGGG